MFKNYKAFTTAIIRKQIGEYENLLKLKANSCISQCSNPFGVWAPSLYLVTFFRDSLEMIMISLKYFRYEAHKVVNILPILPDLYTIVRTLVNKCVRRQTDATEYIKVIIGLSLKSSPNNEYFCSIKIAWDHDKTFFSSKNHWASASSIMIFNVIESLTLGPMQLLLIYKNMLGFVVVIITISMR
ncbi:hypothetical protein BDA99DRAFT_535540 [Phascolomyces articulosus]|uniref:Uncharacterized protein n=1 Tax=Phascolomyces articulosus TaxID=60185 RepID=A0AAD5PFW9_9FUNG|nr:hypothetical protein BDA99DRAFT_535540 [Phascolomyces articulosus]